MFVFILQELGDDDKLNVFSVCCSQASRCFGGRGIWHGRNILYFYLNEHLLIAKHSTEHNSSTACLLNEGIND